MRWEWLDDKEMTWLIKVNSTQRAAFSVVEGLDCSWQKDMKEREKYLRSLERWRMVIVPCSCKQYLKS